MTENLTKDEINYILDLLIKNVLEYQDIVSDPLSHPDDVTDAIKTIDMIYCINAKLKLADETLTVSEHLDKVVVCYMETFPWPTMSLDEWIIQHYDELTVEQRRFANTLSAMYGDLYT